MDVLRTVVEFIKDKFCCIDLLVILKGISSFFLLGALWFFILNTFKLQDFICRKLTKCNIRKMALTKDRNYILSLIFRRDVRDPFTSEAFNELASKMGVSNDLDEFLELAGLQKQNEKNWNAWWRFWSNFFSAPLKKAKKIFLKIKIFVKNHKFSHKC